MNRKLWQKQVSVIRSGCVLKSVPWALEDTRIFLAMIEKHLSDHISSILKP